jgi:predicted house-cleaning noncanonical NTP pyrophosphatase (MazG superfamily)
MNKEKVTQVVTDVINDKITQLIEEMSTNEFVDMIKDKLVENGIEFDDDNEEEVEEIFEIVGSRVVPLLHKMSEYIIGVNIPID